MKPNAVGRLIVTALAPPLTVSALLTLMAARLVWSDKVPTLRVPVLLKVRLETVRLLEPGEIEPPAFTVTVPFTVPSPARVAPLLTVLGLVMLPSTSSVPALTVVAPV